MTPNPPAAALIPGRESSFEWLRLGSALLVVLCHFAALYASYFHAFDVDNATLRTAPSAITTTLTALYFQFHGAYVFFAISGFVITRPWFINAQAPAKLPFLGRRAFRLLPAATAAILVAALFDFFHLEIRSIDVATLLLNLFYLNWLPPYVAPPILIVTWTLAVEWLFYLTAPFIANILLSQRRRVIVALLLAMLLGVTLRTWTANAYAYPLYFAAGIAIAIKRSASGNLPSNARSGWLLAAGVLTILVASLLYAWQAPIHWRPVQWAWRPFDTFVVIHLTGTIALLWWASGPASSQGHASKVLSALPALTYSIYLWHLPACLLVFAAMRNVALPVAQLPEMARLPVLLAAATLLTLALATFSYLTTERPYFRWKQRQSLAKVSAGVD